MTKYVKSKCRDPEFIAFPFASKAKVQCNCSLNSNSHSVSIFHLFLNGKEIKTNFSNSRPLNLYLLFSRFLSIYVTIPPPSMHHKLCSDWPVSPGATGTEYWPVTSNKWPVWAMTSRRLSVDCWMPRQTDVCLCVECWLYLLSMRIKLV